MTDPTNEEPSAAAPAAGVYQDAATLTGLDPPQVPLSAVAADNFSNPSLSVDNDDRDKDSAVGGMSAVTSTISLRSSIYEHVEENGRTYHRYKSGSESR
jgi:hypothetical protein